MCDENKDPRGGSSKIPQPSKVLPTARRVQERPSNSSASMGPPQTKGRSKLELSNLKPATTRKTQSRPQSSQGLRANSALEVRHQRSHSATSNQEPEDRASFLESVLQRNMKDRNEELATEVRRLKTEAGDWELSKKKLEDQIGDLQEKLQYQQDQQYQRETKIRDDYIQKMQAQEDKISELLRANAESTSSHTIELSNIKAGIREQAQVEVENKRQELVRYYEDKDKHQNDQMKLRLEQERYDLQERYQNELQNERMRMEQEWHRLQHEQKQNQESLKHQAQLEQQNLQASFDQERTKYEDKITEANHSITQHQKKEEELHRQIKSCHQELSKVQDDLKNEKHEKETLQDALSQVSASSNSMESIAKSQESQLAELRYQLDLQKQKAEEMRTEAIKADEERELAKSKLLKEEVLRRKLHNQVQELKGNIRVFCRVRPQLPSDNGSGAQIGFPDEDESGQEIVLSSGSASPSGKPSQKRHSFEFDKVFGPQSNNGQVFDEISQLVQSALDGYNVCIFAYGQTGSGKTHTMLAEDDGMIPRAVTQIFETADSMKERGWEYELKGQFLEIYNEQLVDLLGEADPDAKYEIHHDQKLHKTTVTNLKTVPLSSPSKVHSVLHHAYKNRSVAATKVNERSSRSHSVFMLKIKGENQLTGKSHEGTLNLIDLAGSERLTQSQASGDRLKETQAINKSLSCLGDVIHALGNSKEGSHVPYRNSKLTYLLQYSLSGNSKTLMFVNVSPLEPHVNETVSSLRFATKVNNTKIKK